MADYPGLLPASGGFFTGTNWRSGAVRRVAHADATPGVALDGAGRSDGVEDSAVAANGGPPRRPAPDIQNSGTTIIKDHTYLNISGVVNNKGAIILEGSHYGAYLNVVGSATLTGGGRVVLQKYLHPNNFIDGGALTNLNNTIVGAGVINPLMTLINGAAGVIDGSAGPDNGENPTYLLVEARSITNNGLIESTGTAPGLVIRGSTVDGSGGGVILANGADLRLEATIAGGTLSATGGGVLEMYSGALDGRASAVHNTTNLMLMGNADVTVLGAIANTGAITLASTVGYRSAITVGAGGATLTGGGQVALSGGTTIQSAAAGDVLTNFDNTITGTGVLGASGGSGFLTLVNDAGGVIDGQSGLVLDSGTATVTNRGLIEATGSAGLTLSTGEIDGGTLGVILATDGASVILAGADIVGGTLSTAGSGVIQAHSGMLDGTKAVVHVTGVLEIDAHYSLTLDGKIANSGTIGVLGGGFYDADLVVGAADAVLTGGGQVYLGSRGVILSAAAGDTLTNFDNTISGAGVIGPGSGGSLSLINAARGVIDGDTGSIALRLDLGSGTLTNNGLIEATSSAGVVLKSGVVDGSGGGTILAADGGVVTLVAGGVVAGGTLSTAGSGVILSANGYLDGTGSAVHLTGLLNVANHAALAITGTIDNTGTILPLGGGFYNSFLSVVGSGATLTGGGQIYLGSRSFINAAPGAAFTNDGNTITGNGNFFYGQITVVNLAGTIDDSGPSALTLPTAGGVFTNGGVLEATGTGGLIIQNATLYQSTGGQVFAGNGSTVSLVGVHDIGGSFNTAGTGAVVAAGGCVLDGSTSMVSNLGLFQIVGGATLTALGAIDNSGTLALENSGAAELLFSRNATLTGGGTVELNAVGTNDIQGSRPSVVLTNVDNTIVGSGAIGAGRLDLINRAAGVIDADGKAALTIATGMNAVTNAGLIEATDGGRCVIKSAVVNTGTLETNGGTLTLEGAVTGSGAVTIVAGVLAITNANADEAVAFSGTFGRLKLAHSQTFGGAVSGFSRIGHTSFDLLDVGFVSASEASFSGTATRGVLTVTDTATGATARITLVGDYRHSTFTAASDHHGGTVVTASPKPGGGEQPASPARAPPHPFIAAMAGFGSAMAGHVHTSAEPRALASMLAAPRIEAA